MERDIWGANVKSLGVQLHGWVLELFLPKKWPLVRGEPITVLPWFKGRFEV